MDTTEVLLDADGEVIGGKKEDSEQFDAPGGIPGLILVPRDEDEEQWRGQAAENGEDINSETEENGREGRKRGGTNVEDASAPRFHPQFAGIEMDPKSKGRKKKEKAHSREGEEAEVEG